MIKFFTFVIIFFIPLFSFSAENELNLIPKKIHYVWFGSEDVPVTIKKAVETWKKYMPNYEIKRWDEKTCNIDRNPYIKDLVKNKKYTFASDWCRVNVVYQEGGIYFDTDFILTDSIESLLTKPLVLAYESNENISGGIFAATPKHPFMQKLVEFLDNKDAGLIGIPKVLVKLLNEHKNDIGDYIIYPENVLMLDFGGGENKGYHMYADGTTDFGSCMKFYKFFQKKFLNNKAYCLTDCENDVGEWAVLLPENKFYIVHNQNGCFYADKEIQRGNYEIFHKELFQFLKLRYDSGQEIKYACTDKSCWIENW